MHTSCIFPIWKELNVKQKSFRKAIGLNMKYVSIKIWTQPSLNAFFQWEWNCLVDTMTSYCLLKEELRFSPILSR